MPHPLALYHEFLPLPVVNWNFLTTQSLTSFSRTSNATLFDSTGKLTYAANNLLFNSKDFAFWNNSPGTTSETTAPDGTNSARKAVLGTNTQVYQGGSFGTGYFVGSIYVKKNNAQFACLQIETNSTAYQCFINLDTGETSASTNATASAVSAGNGWWRISVKTNIQITAAYFTFQSASSLAAQNGGGTYYLWGPQLEIVTYQTTPSTYNPTTTAPYYGPRYPYAYNGTTWDAQGLLVEAAGTNLATYSEAFDNAAWTKHISLVAVDANQATSPDGTNSADTLRFASAASNLFLLYNTSGITVTNGTTYSTSIFVKAIAGGVGFVAIAANLNGDYRYSLCLNLSDGTVSNLGSWTTAASYSVASVGNGWWRVSIKGTPTNGQAYIEVWPRLTAGAPNNNITVASGDVGKGLYIWGAQVELGDPATAYIPNLSTGTTTRNADTSLAFSAINLPTGLSFSRASNAMQYDAAGRLTYAPNNLALYSATPGGTGWTTVQLGYAGNVVTVSSGSNNHFTYRSVGSIAAGNYIMSADITYGNKAWVFLQTYDGTNSYAASFDIQNGVTGATTSGVTSGVIPLGGGRYTIWMKATHALSGTGVIYWGVNNTNVAGSQVWNALGTETVTLNNISMSAVSYEELARPCDQVITTSSAYYGPRYDYDPLTRLPKGLLIEEARTNLFTYSNTFSDASWQRISSTIAQGYAAPDGTTTAWTFTEGADNTNHLIYKMAQPTISAATTYTFSVYAKAGSRPYLQMNYQDIGNRYATVVFDLSIGAPTQTGVSSVTLVGTAATSIGNGWYRCSMTFTTGTVAANTYIYIGGAPAATGNTFNPTGDLSYQGSSKTFYLFGAQIEVGSFPTSYVPTTSASVARSADIATLTGTALTTLKGTAGSAIAETGPLPAVTTNQPVLLGSDLMGGGGSLLYANIANNTTASTYGGTAVLSATLGSSSNWSSTTRAAVAWSVGVRSIVANAGTVQTDANGFTIASPSTVTFACKGDNTAQVNSWVRKFAAYNVRLSNPQLQQKSTVGAIF